MREAHVIELIQAYQEVDVKKILAKCQPRVPFFFGKMRKGILIQDHLGDGASEK